MDQPGETDQSGSEQAQGAWFRSHEVRISTAQIDYAVEETLAGVDRPLPGHIGTACSRQIAGKRIVVGAVSMSRESPIRSLKGSLENDAVGGSIHTIAGNREHSASGERCDITLARDGAQTCAIQGTGS